MSDPLDLLVAETRARREALHALIGRVRRDHAVWRQTVSQIPARARLTVAQREAFRRCLSRRRRSE